MRRIRHVEGLSTTSVSILFLFFPFVFFCGTVCHESGSGVVDAHRPVFCCLSFVSAVLVCGKSSQLLKHTLSVFLSVWKTSHSTERLCSCSAGFLSFLRGRLIFHPYCFYSLMCVQSPRRASMVRSGGGKATPCCVVVLSLFSFGICTCNPPEYLCSTTLYWCCCKPLLGTERLFVKTIPR
ncbi:unnamed protein product [Ectocarpus sp. 4 AP-2014]